MTDGVRIQAPCRQPAVNGIVSAYQSTSESALVGRYFSAPRRGHRASTAPPSGWLPPRWPAMLPCGVTRARSLAGTTCPHSDSGPSHPTARSRWPKAKPDAHRPATATTVCCAEPVQPSYRVCGRQFTHSTTCQEYGPQAKPLSAQAAVPRLAIHCAQSTGSHGYRPIALRQS